MPSVMRWIDGWHSNAALESDPCISKKIGWVVSAVLWMRKDGLATADIEALHGDDPSLGKIESDDFLKQRMPFGPFLAMAAMEFVLLRRSIEELLTWWTGGAL